MSVLPHDEARRLLDAAPLRPLVRPLAERGRLCRWPHGALVVKEGEPGDGLLIVIVGRVKVYSEAVFSRVGPGRAPTRARAITFGIHGPGDYVGLSSLDGGPRTASAVALEPVVCSAVSDAAIRRHVTEHPEFALDLIEQVVRRARSVTANARGLALLDVYGRLRMLLDELAGAAVADGSRLIAQRLTHAETADRLGCSREMVSRLMKDLDTGGYLRREGRGLRLVRPLPTRW